MSCGIQKINRTFLVTVKAKNMLRGSLLFVSCVLNRAFPLIFAVLVRNT